MNATTNTEHLNNLVRENTAFTSIAALRQAMDNGYVPSFYNTGSNKNRAMALADTLRAMGYRVWTGR